MKFTENYKFKKPEDEDFILVADLNFNADKVDKLIKKINDSIKELSDMGILDLLDGKADLDPNTGKVKATQLPEVKIFNFKAYGALGQLPKPGDVDYLYLIKPTNNIYRWTGSEYVKVVYNAIIPDGGNAGQVLKKNSRGEIVWDTDNNTTYKLATISADGLLAAKDKKKLDNLASTRSDNEATQSARGYMSAADKKKLDSSYTKTEVDQLLVKFKEEISGDILEQILAYS